MNYDTILKQKPLTVEKEVALATEYAVSKSPRILKELTEANLRFVYSIAKNYHFKNNKLSFDDLFNEGSIGLIKGIKKFDVTRGFKLISYSVWWINQTILEYIRTTKYIKKPSSNNTIVKNIEKFKIEYINKYGFLPPIQTIADNCEYTEKEIIDNLRYNRNKVIHYENFNDEENNAIENVPDKIDTSEIIAKERVDDLIALIKNERAKKIFINYFGIDTKQKTYKEIGEMFGVSGAAIANTNQRTIKKLKAMRIVEANRNFKISIPKQLENKKELNKKELNKKITDEQIENLILKVRKEFNEVNGKVNLELDKNIEKVNPTPDKNIIEKTKEHTKTEKKKFFGSIFGLFK